MEDQEFTAQASKSGHHPSSSFDLELGVPTAPEMLQGLRSQVMVEVCKKQAEWKEQYAAAASMPTLLY